MSKKNTVRFYDFDRQFSEMKRETITLRVFGEDYTIPASVPAIIPLELSRYEAEDGVPTKVMFKIVRVLFGDATLDRWTVNPNFSADMLGEIIKTTFAMINGEDPTQTEPEEVTEDSAGESPNA